MKTTKNTRLTKKDRTAIIAKLRSDFSKEKEYELPYLLDKYAMNAERLDAWICMLNYVTYWGYDDITVPLSDIWQDEIPETKETTVTLKYFKKDSARYYYIALNHDGNVYEAEVKELSIIISDVAYLTEINGLPADNTLQSVALHRALVELLTKSGIVEKPRKLYE